MFHYAIISTKQSESFTFKPTWMILNYHLARKSFCCCNNKKCADDRIKLVLSGKPHDKPEEIKELLFPEEAALSCTANIFGSNYGRALYGYNAIT